VAIAFVGGNGPLLAQWWLDLSEIQAMLLASQPIIAMQAERIELSKKSIELKQKIKQMQSITSQDRSTSILGIIAKSVSSANGALQIQELHVAVSAKLMDAPVADRNKLIANQCQVTLKGISIESESISTFMENLQASSVFPKIELHSTQERVVSNRSIQEFHLECIGND